MVLIHLKGQEIYTEAPLFENENNTESNTADDSTDALIYMGYTSFDIRDIEYVGTIELFISRSDFIF